MPLKELPDRAAASHDASLAQNRHDLDQDQVRLLLNYLKQSICVLFERRNAAPGRLWCSTPDIRPMLEPFYGRARAYFKAFSRFPPRRARLNSFNYASTQILRVSPWHRSAPATPNQWANTRSFPGAWESIRLGLHKSQFKGVGNRSGHGPITSTCCHLRPTSYDDSVVPECACALTPIGLPVDNPPRQIAGLPAGYTNSPEDSRNHCYPISGPKPFFSADRIACRTIPMANSYASSGVVSPSCPHSPACLRSCIK